MGNMRKAGLGAALLILVFGVSAQQEAGLQNGKWRAALKRSDGHDIVFNFEVKDSNNRKILYIRNAAERLLVDDITVQGDSVWIRLPFFESQIRAAFTQDRNQLNGWWIKKLVDKDQLIPFTAYAGQAYRYPVLAPATINITGRWAVRFSSEGSKEPELSVGEFVQKGNKLTGTFLNPTGDYRYLEGTVNGDSLTLSCFDGGHAYLFTAKIEGNSLVGGNFFSGFSYRENWTAQKDPKAKLPDEFSLTKLKEPGSRLDFSFPDLDGKMVSIKDGRFKNKVVLIQIMGSWCPNCMDETQFLSGLYDRYKNKGVEVIGLAYERSTDFTRSQKSLRGFQQRFQVKYPILITGVAVGDPQRAEKTLPQLESIKGFPTTLFLDKAGRVQKIHTGFNGPATGEHYEEEKKTFYRIIDQALGQ
jgi:thiol-disulfide isomerase/thioredoxin